MTEYIPWNVYPRPQLRRESCLILNGYWQFALTTEGESAWDGSYPDRILVPYCPESKLSGLHMPILPRQTMHYRRSFDVDDAFMRDRTILHFGAVDQSCSVFINGCKVGSHVGGYTPFSFDISKQIKCGKNIITVDVTDPLNHDLPWGKQKYRRGGMWYTPVSGIWQTVWIESISNDAVRSLKIQPSLDRVSITVETNAPMFRITVPEIGYESEHTEATVTIHVPSPINWSPDTPKLYSFTVETENDLVSSYFALRTVETKFDNQGYARIFLNGEPIFLHGILDQGYFDDGIYTPKSPECYEGDILFMKEMGFNFLRKHIKLESAVFYHLCDRLGILVMQDFINTGTYSFLRDTVLPTIGFKRMPNFFRSVGSVAKAFFLQTASEIQECLYNSPSVIAYTIFNEGWGQFDTNRVYQLLKSRDPSRLYDSASGWFVPKMSDFDSRHIYFKKIKMKAGKRPLLLSEFGGYAYRDPQHSFSPKTYGYRTFENAEQLEDAIVNLYETEVIPMIKRGLCGAIYTQLSDIEDEINGLLTYDRQVSKVNPDRLRQLTEKMTL